jgi:hypothetical protein
MTRSRSSWYCYLLYAKVYTILVGVQGGFYGGFLGLAIGQPWNI